MVLDESTNKTYYGCQQQWYGTEWQRLSGCGPSVASNIVHYLNHITQSTCGLGQSLNSKRNCLSLMEEIWKYVTPTYEGIPTTKMWYEAMLTYTETKGLNVEYGFCDVPKDRSRRPKLQEILNFIEDALLIDAPIAFLNLCNGDEDNLDEWHWVTIISLDFTEDGTSALVNILDEGQIKKIDLALWYNTTMQGGGFVFFTAA